MRRCWFGYAGRKFINGGVFPRISPLLGSHVKIVRTKKLYQLPPAVHFAKRGMDCFGFCFCTSGFSDTF